MNKFHSLLKLELNQIFNSLFGSKRTHKSAAKMAIFSIFMPALFCIYLTGTYTLAMVHSLAAKDSYLILLMGIVLATLLTFVLTFYSAGGHLFQFKDFDLLMSLPITNQSILLSKLVAFVLYNYFFVFFLLLSPVIGYVYLTATVIPLIFYVYVALGSFLLPIVPIIISSIVAFLIMMISSRFKYRNLVNIAISFLLLLGIFYLSFTAQNVIETIGASLDSIMLAMKTYFPPMYYYINLLRTLNFVDLLRYMAWSLLPWILFIFFFSKGFKRLNNSLAITKVSKGKVFNASKLQKSSRWMALFTKEWKAYINCPIYVLNTLVGPVLAVFGTLFMVFKSPQELETMLAMPGFSNYLYLMHFPMFGFMIATSSTTASSISLEGKSLWLVKSHPVQTRTIFLAKIALNLLILIPILGSMAIIAGIRFNFGIEETLYLVMAVLLCSGFVSMVGLLMNLFFPRFDWKSEVSVVKQSISVIGSMAICAATFALLSYLYVKFAMKMDPLIGIRIGLSTLTLLNVGVWGLLSSKGYRLFNSL